MNSAARPISANRAAATGWITFSGMRRVMRSPSRTPGALARIMPSVVPATTAARLAYYAARATVATWVLSPISAMKNAMKVVP